MDRRNSVILRYLRSREIDVRKINFLLFLCDNLCYHILLFLLNIIRVDIHSFQLLIIL